MPFTPPHIPSPTRSLRSKASEAGAESSSRHRSRTSQPYCLNSASESTTSKQRLSSSSATLPPTASPQGSVRAIASMQQDITVLLDHDPPVRGVPTPPDPIPRLADSSLGKLLSLTIMEFDGTLPADSLEPPFRVVWPGGRSVDIRPKSSGGMRAALKRRGGIPVGGAKGKEGATNSSSSGNVDAPLAGPSRNAAQAGPSQSILSSPPPSPGGTQHELHEAINGSIYDVLMNGFEGYSTDDPVGAGPSTALEATLDETLRDLGDNPELGQWLDSHPLETLDTLPADSLAANSLPPHLDVTSQQNQPASPAGTGCARPAGKPRPRRVSLEIQPSGKTQREPLTTPTPASQMAPPRRTSVGAVSRNPSVPPSPISRPSSSVEYLGSSSPLKRSLPDDTDTSAPVMENRGASRSKPALHKGTSMTKSTATTRLARSKTSAATKPSASTRATRASSSRPAARSARAAVAAMVKEPYPTIVEEQPRKRRRTERSVSIPQRAEILLPMSDGKRYGREGKWPKFSKDWNNWRMLKVRPHTVRY